MLWARLNFLSQVLDYDSKIVHLIAVIRSPYGLKQLTMRHCLIRTLRQIAQQVELLWREMRRRRPARHRPCGEVDRKLAKLEFGGRCLTHGHTTERGAYSSQKFRRAKRLCDEVVCASVQGD